MLFLEYLGKIIRVLPSQEDFNTTIQHNISNLVIKNSMFGFKVFVVILIYMLQNLRKIVQQNYSPLMGRT